jgi:hypothetical protein
MGDLISRSALIETIEQDIKMTERFMERTASPCQEYSCLNAQLNTLKSFKAIVEDKPCAYDVEKVVAELEEEKNSTYERCVKGMFDALFKDMVKKISNGGKE